MPIDPKLIAKTTAFQNNCLLNTLVHAIYYHYFEAAGSPKMPKSGKVALLKHFYEHYGITVPLDLTALENMIENLRNPVHREIVFGPVLRSMLGTESARTVGAELETNDDFLRLANSFGILVESYGSPASASSRVDFNPDKDQLQSTRTSQEENISKAGAEACLLKLLHKNNHWEFEAKDAIAANAHNRDYEDRYRYGREHAEEVKKRLSAALKAGNLNLSQVLRSYEMEQEASPSPIGQMFASGLNDASTLAIENLVNFGNSLSTIFGRNSFIGKLFSTVIPAVLGFVGLMRKLSKVISPQQKLSDEELTAEGVIFNRYVDKLPEDMQGRFYQQWRKSPDAPVLWQDLVEQLQQEGEFEEANALLKIRAQASFKSPEAADSHSSTGGDLAVRWKHLQEEQHRLETANALPMDGLSERNVSSAETRRQAILRAISNRTSSSRSTTPIPAKRTSNVVTLGT